MRKKRVKLGESYHIDKPCKTFISAIAEVTRRSLRDVTTDGSTDVSVKENEIVYIRFSLCGKPKILFYHSACWES